MLGALRHDTNGLFQLIATGTKGNTPNLLHIVATLSQVEIGNRRMETTFAFQRTSPYFARFATDPAAYGYVKHGYIEGLSASEYVFNTMNGRFDLINKALSTASTGYQNRKAVMSLQDTTDNYRRVVADTQVVQLIYGDDGLDARMVDFVDFRTVKLSDADLAAECRLDLVGAGVAQAPPAHQEVFDRAFARVRADRDWYRETFIRHENMNFDRVLKTARQMPVNVNRLRVEALLRLASQGETSRAPNESEMVRAQEKVDNFRKRLQYVLVNEIQERRGAPVPLHFQKATRLFAMLVDADLGGRALLTTPPAALDEILGEARRRYEGALISYGAAVGILAAQCVSEPLTQYMLDSHHRSVGSGTSKAGIVRPAEIFGAKPVESELAPEMLLRLTPDAEASHDAATQVANQIELL